MRRHGAVSIVWLLILIFLAGLIPTAVASSAVQPDAPLAHGGQTQSAVTDPRLQQVGYIPGQRVDPPHGGGRCPTPLTGAQKTEDLTGIKGFFKISSYHKTNISSKNDNSLPKDLLRSLHRMRPAPYQQD